MAGKDLLSRLVDALASACREIVTQLSDAGSAQDWQARAGVLTPGGPVPPDGQAVAARLDTLRAEAATDQSDSIELIQRFSAAMTDIVAFVQQVSGVSDRDDAWNLVATYLDLVAVDRLREKEPGALALLRALHLLSDDRLLIADLFRSGADWGRFLLGEPADDDATVDNLSLIFGAALVALDHVLPVPLEDTTGEPWRVDMLFGWDPEPSPAMPHTAHVLQRMFTLRFQHLDAGDGVGVQASLGLSGAWVPPADGGTGLYLALDVGDQISFPIGAQLELLLEVESGDALEAFLGPSPFVRSGLSNTTGKIMLRRKQEVADAWTIGHDDTTHLEIGTFQTGFRLADPPAAVLSIGDGALVVPQDSLGFLSSVVPSGGLKLTFDVEAAIDVHGTLSLTGGAGMTVVLPVNRSIVGVTVRAVTVALAVAGEAVSLAATVAFSVRVAGVLIVTVDGLGAQLVWTLPDSPKLIGTGAPTTHGNLGSWGDLSLPTVRPKGIGLQFGVDPVKGGGFLYFDHPHHTYGGVLEASVSLCGRGLDIKGAGLLRETDVGYDVVLIVSVQFDPAPQFLGMSLNGIGGMVGINVAVDVDKLRSGVHDGAISRLLFPDDPVANASAIVATMASVFPHHQGGRVVGLLLQLGFGAPTHFVTLSLGIVVTYPEPTLLLLLGSLRVQVSAADVSVLSLRVDFLGVVDFGKPTYSFDGSLVDSRFAAFPLTGDMAVRAGAQAFVISFGGYHPDFHPPVQLPPLRRLAIDVSPSSLMKIRAELYVAITSNTFQTGLHASLDIDAGAASLHGWLDFDTLFQWKPKLYFSMRNDIGLELRVGGSSWAGISVDLFLEGPGPWHAKGDASLHLFFFTIHVGFEHSWGEDDTVALPPQVDPSELVATALAADGAWSTVSLDGPSAATVRADIGGGIRLHPDGRLCARQQEVPIGIPITRVGRSPVAGGSATVQLSATGLESAPSTGQFAASQFVDLTSDEQLARPSFEPYQDGLIFGPTTTVLSAEQPTSAAYETVFVPDVSPRHRGPMPGALLTHGLLVGAVARSGQHFATLHDGPHQTVTLTEPAYRLVLAGSLAPDPGAPQEFSSAVAAFAAVAGRDDRLVVVGAHEAEL